MLNLSSWFSLLASPNLSERGEGSSAKFYHRFTLNGRFRYHEFGSNSGMEATRYGDWEYHGRCTDF